jgi:hypothetical protein
MKKLLILLLSLLLLITISCDRPKQSNDLAYLLEYAKSPVIIVATGKNEGNFEAYKYYIIFKDSNGTIYEYIGAEYNLKIGDTIK